MKLVIDIDGLVHRQLQPHDHPYDRWLPNHVSARMRNAKPAPAGVGVTCLVCIEEWEKHVRQKAMQGREREAFERHRLK